jgi:hypothetical protein
MMELKPRAQRFTVTLPIKYRAVNESEWQDGKTVNISHTGILFHANTEIALNTQLEIQIEFPTMSTLSGDAMIVRAAEPSTLVAAKIQNYSLSHRCL